jgi:phosphate/sulfate permease
MKRVVGGSILIFLGLFMLLGFFASTKESSFAVNAIMMLLFVVAPIIGGILAIRSHFTSQQKVSKEQKKALQNAREKEVIHLAHAKGGILTIPEIIAETSLNSDEAEEVMQEMVVKGYVDMKTTESGVIIYEFYEIIKQKEEAQFLKEKSSKIDRLIE